MSAAVYCTPLFSDPSSGSLCTLVWVTNPVIDTMIQSDTQKEVLHNQWWAGWMNWHERHLPTHNVSQPFCPQIMVQVYMLPVDVQWRTFALWFAFLPFVCSSSSPSLLVLCVLLTSFVLLVVVLKTNCAQLDWCLTMWTDHSFIILNIIVNVYIIYQAS